jgi:hypothetical protein
MSEGGEERRTLEMRLAAIEDKLAQMSVSEEEMRAFQKVAALTGSRAAPALSPQVCSVNCVIAIPVSVSGTGITCHNCAIFQALSLGTPAAGSAGAGGLGFAGLGTR